MEPRDLFIRFRGDTSEAEAALNRVNQGLKQTEEAAKKTSETLGKIPSAIPPPPPLPPGSKPDEFSKIAAAFEQIQKAGNLTSKDISAAATAFSNLGKAGLDTKGGLSSVASQLETLSKSGKLSGEEVQKLQTTFTQLSSAGIKSGDDLNKLAGVFGVLGGKQKETTQTSEGLTSSAVALAAALGAAVGTAIVALAARFAQLLPEMIKAGEVASNINDSFVRLEGGSVLAEQALGKLRVATQGLVSDLDIKQTVNQGLLLGLDPSKMDQLAAAATRLGQAVGRDATSALNDLILGLSRGSPRILDNLGIVVKAEDAYKKYADANHLLVSELTEAEKKLSIQTEAAEQAQKKVEELGPPVRNAATSFHEIVTALGNFGTGIATAIANSEELIIILDRIQEHARNARDVLRFVFSDDDVAKAARLQQKIDSLTPKPGGIDFGDAFKAEREKAQAELDQIRQSIKDTNITADVDAALREINAKNKFKSEQDDERARVKAEAAAKAAAEAAKRAAKEQEDALDSLAKKREEVFTKSQQQADLLGLQKAIQSGNDSDIAAFAAKVHKDTADELYAGLSETLKKAGLGPESQQFADILAAKTKESMDKALLQSNQNIVKYQQQLATNQINYAIEEATKSGNLKLVGQLQNQLRDNQYREIFKQVEKQQIESGYTVEAAKLQAAKEAGAQIAIIDQQNAHHLEELQKQAFQNSVAFFSDLLSSAIDGTGKDLEQTLLEALKKVGIGFASQIGGNLLQSLRLNLGSISSASGLGQSLAAAIGFGGGGIKPLTSLFGGSAPSGIIANAAAAVGGGTATGAATGTGLTATLGSLGPIGGSLLSGGAVIIGTGAGAALLASGIKQGGLGGGALGGIGGGLVGGSLFGGIGASVLGPLGALAGAFGGDLFGGDSKAAAERQAREDLLNKITGGDYKDFSFGVVGNSGISHLDPNTFNIQGANNPLSGGPTGTQGDVTALVSPLSELLTGGNGKLKDDLAGIFTTAVGEVTNFNEAIVNTESLMGKLNLNAEDAKTGLFQLFKDGKIALNEFTTGIYELDVIQQDVFQGPNGIAEGFQIIADQLGNGTNQGLYGAVAALSTEVNTFGKQGLKTTKEIADYFAKAGDTVHAKFFQVLSDQGFKTADDLKNALNNPDLFIQLLSDLQGAGDLTQGLASSQGEVASQSDNAYTKMVSGAGAAKSAQQKLNDEIQKTIDLQKKVTGGGGSSTPSGDTPDESEGGGTTTPTTNNRVGKTRSRVQNPRNANGL